jgi:TolB protein
MRILSARRTPTRHAADPCCSVLQPGLAPSQRIVSTLAGAMLFIDANQGNLQPLQPMPLALPDFLANSSSDGESAHRIPQIIAANLRGSGLFASIDQVPLIERIDFDRQPRFTAGRPAQALGVSTANRTDASWPSSGFGTCSAKSNSTDSFICRCRTISAASLTSFFGPDLYERLTGEKGYFDSRIVYVHEPKDRRIKRLAVTDQDGAGVRYLTNTVAKGWAGCCIIIIRKPRNLAEKSRMILWLEVDCMCARTTM